MGSKLADIGAAFDVGDKDLRELRRQRRRDILTKIAQVSAPIVSVILGVLAAEAVYPVHSHPYDTYPYVPIMLASSTTSHHERRPWTAPIVLSVALFIVTFAFVALFNSAANDNYGVTTKYGVFSGRGDVGGIKT